MSSETFLIYNSSIVVTQAQGQKIQVPHITNSYQTICDQSLVQYTGYFIFYSCNKGKSGLPAPYDISDRPQVCVTKVRISIIVHSQVFYNVFEYWPHLLYEEHESIMLQQNLSL